MLSSKLFRTSLTRLMNLHRKCSDKVESSTEFARKEKTESEEEKPFKLPPEPDNCCMSGCENCVWIQYAKELTDLYDMSGDAAKKILLEKIKDPTMQIFLRMELHAMEKKKKS